MRLEFESNVSSVPFAENGFAEKSAENALAPTAELLDAGIKAAQTGNRSEARHLLLRVTETEPHNENAWLWLASISEYPEELLIFLNNVLNVNPENVRAKEWMKQTKSLLAKTFVQRGIDAIKENQNDFAKQCFYQAAAQDDTNEMAWLWLASVSDKAEEKTVHLNKALQINPANEDAQTALKAVHHEMAKTLFQKAVSAADTKDAHTAAELIKEVLQKSPEMEEAWLLKAALADDTNDKIRYYEKVLEINPANEFAQNDLKNIHHKLTLALLQNAKAAAFAGESQAANEMLEKVLEKAPEMVEAWLLKSHLALGFDEKMRCFERVLEINPENETAKSGLNTLRAFMPQIESGKDEYVQMAEEFAAETHEETTHEETAYEEIAHEETLFFAAETQTDTALYFEENSQPAEAEDYFAQESEIASENQPTEELNAAQIAEYAEPTVETVENKEKEWSIHESEMSFANLEATKEKTEETPNEKAAADNFENFSLEAVEEFQNETEKSEVQTETLEHEPTQLFEKPSENLDSDDFSFQAPTNTNGDFSHSLNSYEPAAEEAFAPIQELSPEPTAESFFSNETIESNFHENGSAEKFEKATENSAEISFAELNLSPTTEEFPAHTEEIVEQAAEETHEQLAKETHEAAAEVLPEMPKASVHQEGFACPFCNVENDAQAFVCSSCRAVLSLSDLEMLLANQNADKEVLLQTVNRMEFEKSAREFNEFELMFLGIGQINLKNLRRGFAYLQQASQLNPNNVLLGSQVNALAIRLSEIERQNEIHSSMPKGRTILVVDDSPTVRKLISGKLEKSGHEVCCAVDGMDALAKLSEITPDLILLDITMPRMDGYQVCKMIRSTDATKDIPVVMISGKDGFFDKVRGRMAGTTGYITKPFGPETLMKALDIYIKPIHETKLENSILAEV